MSSSAGASKPLDVGFKGVKFLAVKSVEEVEVRSQRARSILPSRCSLRSAIAASQSVSSKSSRVDPAGGLDVCSTFTRNLSEPLRLAKTMRLFLALPGGLKCYLEPSSIRLN